MGRHMFTSLRVPALALLGILAAEAASAQDCCGSPQRTVYTTLYQPQPVTTYRLEYETVFESKEITVQRPVWETEYREQRYTVAKPVVETSTREDRYTVMRPVWETSERDESYDRVRYVTETEMREERHVVERPVFEDAYREEQHVVRRPTTQTMMQDYSYTAYDPVTTMRTDYVDQGGVVNQWIYQPGTVRNRLEWLPGGYVADPATGASYWRRAGLYWVPAASAGSYAVQAQYVPNVVAVQRPQTTYAARVVTEKRPVEVTSYVDEVVTQKVPVRTCRMEQTEEVRKVPHTVQKQVVERVTNKVPVQTCRWVEQEMVRKVPVTTQRVVYEEKVEKVPVQVCRMVTETKTVQEPRTIATWRPVQATQCVPRTVVMHVPADDACYSGIPTTTYYYPAAPSATGAPVTTQRVPTEAKPETKKDSSVLRSEAGKNGESGPDLGTPGKPATDRPAEAPAAAREKATPRDSDPTGQPKLPKKDDEYNAIFPKELSVDKNEKPAKNSKAG
jgi:hypothetical protein